MFSKLSLLSLVLPLVSALVLEIPEKPTSGGSITIKWTNQEGDPTTWSFELTNEIFHNAFAVANNVDPSTSSLTLTLPIVPVGDGYTLEAVNIGNITDVFAATGTFAIGATTTTVSSASTTISGTTTTTGTVTQTRANSTTLTGATSTTPGFTSVINSASTPSGTATTPSATDTTATTTPSSANFNAGVSLSGNAGGLTAVLLSLGAVMLSL